MPGTTDQDSAYKWWAEAYPNEAYDTDPERFWQFFHQEHPTLSRENMVRFLKGTAAIAHETHR